MDGHMDGSNLASSFGTFFSATTDAEPGSHATFASQLKGLRVRLGYKQVWLASAVGCTDAAVSFWESGKRLPQAYIMARVVEVLRKLGVTSKELVTLDGTWRVEKIRAALAIGQAPRRRTEVTR
jgi:DNA-binding XRE family transcriptional regulator